MIHTVVTPIVIVTYAGRNFQWEWQNFVCVWKYVAVNDLHRMATFEIVFTYFMLHKNGGRGPGWPRPVGRLWRVPAYFFALWKFANFCHPASTCLDLRYPEPGLLTTSRPDPSQPAHKRRGPEKKTVKSLVFCQAPSDTPLWSFLNKKNWPIIIFFENEPLMRETNFTLGPI